MMLKVAHAYKNDLTKMEDIFKEFMSRIRFEDFEYALRNMGEIVTYKVSYARMTTLKEYHNGDGNTNSGLKQGVIGIYERESRNKHIGKYIGKRH